MLSEFEFYGWGCKRVGYITKLGCEKYSGNNVLSTTAGDCSYYKAKSNTSVVCVLFIVGGNVVESAPNPCCLVSINQGIKVDNLRYQKSNTRLNMICNHGYELLKYPFIIICIITALNFFWKNSQIIA